jgi:hypothetical protein
MIFLAKGLLGFCSAYGGQFTGNELYRMAIRLDTRARFPAVCGSVETGDMTSNFIPSRPIVDLRWSLLDLTKSFLFQTRYQKPVSADDVERSWLNPNYGYRDMFPQ